MNYAWAVEQHALGRHVTCGLGVHPAWSGLGQLLAAELTSLEWRTVTWNEVKTNAAQAGFIPAKQNRRGYYHYLP